MILLSRASWRKVRPREADPAKHAQVCETRTKCPVNPHLSRGLIPLPSGFGVVRTTEQPNSKAVCVEVHSTRPAELAQACVAALLSSSCRCLTPQARITTTLFVKRTT